MRELDRLTSDDPTRVMDLLGQTIHVGDREAYIEEVELSTSATGPPRADYALRWLGNSKLRVYVVWMPVLAGDSREAWKPDVLADPRVTQLWDQNQVVGTWLEQHGGPFWDALLVYGPTAR